MLPSRQPRLCAWPARRQPANSPEVGHRLATGELLCFEGCDIGICPIDGFELFVDPLQQNLSGRQVADVPRQPKLVSFRRFIFGSHHRRHFGSL